MANQVLQIYGDRNSQPTRAILIFSKVNGIKFEEVEIKLFTTDVQKPEFFAVNPLRKVPAIAHGDFTLFESHAILTYLASWYKVADDWYPADIRKRAKVQSVLDWHHSTLRYASRMAQASGGYGSSSNSRIGSSSKDMFCGHKTRADLRTVKFGPNTGRKFWGCSLWPVENCGFFRWEDEIDVQGCKKDEEDNEVQRHQLQFEIKSLEEKCRRLKEKNKNLQQVIQGLNIELTQMRMEVMRCSRGEKYFGMALIMSLMSIAVVGFLLK